MITSNKRPLKLKKIHVQILTDSEKASIKGGGRPINTLTTIDNN